MERWRLTASAGLILVCAQVTAQGDKAPVETTQTPAAKDWSKIVVATEASGYRMGNPDAPVKLVHYGSLSCPPCSRFFHEGYASLEVYVAKGTVSWEFRPFLIHPQDVPATLLTMCVGSSRFLPVVRKMMADTNIWAFRRDGGYPSERQLQQWSRLGPNESAAKMATFFGMQNYVKKFGISRAKANACLANKPMLARFYSVSELGRKQGVVGVPAFFLNGNKLDVSAWGDLEPLLVKSGA